MPPKGGRKRAASTGPPQSKSAKSARTEPTPTPRVTRSTRRLRSNSPSSQSPLRALSPPKRGRKPKPIPEDAEAEKREEQAQVTQETENSNEMENGVDNEIENENEVENVNANGSQETNATDDMDKDSSDKNNYDDDNELESHDEMVQPSVEIPDAIENEDTHEDTTDTNTDEENETANENQASQLSVGPSDIEESVEEENSTQQTLQGQLQTEEEDALAHPEIEQAESQNETLEDEQTPTAPIVAAAHENLPVEIHAQPERNQLYTSKESFPSAEYVGTPNSPTILHSTGPVDNIAVTKELGVNSTYNSDTNVLPSTPESVRKEMRTLNCKSATELRIVIKNLMCERREALYQVNHFKHQSTVTIEENDELREQVNDLRKELRDLQRLANIYKAELLGFERTPTKAGRKRSAPSPTGSDDEFEEPPSRRFKLTPNRHHVRFDRDSLCYENADSRTQALRGEHGSTTQSFPTAGGDYLMSGGLGPSSDVDETNNNNTKTTDVAQAEPPKTPRFSTWKRLFTPVASVKNMFKLNTAPRTDPVHRIAPAPTNPQTETPAKTSQEDAPTMMDKSRPLRDAPWMLRDRRYPKSISTSVGVPPSGQPDSQDSNEGSTQRMPGSFISELSTPRGPVSFFNEDEKTRAQPHSQSIPRHSFIPQTAPQPRRRGTVLQRRREHEQRLAEAEAAEAAEIAEQKKKKEDEETQRMRREALRTRNMNIPPEVIRASFVEKFGASARELQEQLNSGVQVGMKRKAQDINAEAIPNPRGSSYGMDDDYFEADESTLNEPSGGNSARGTAELNESPADRMEDLPTSTPSKKPRLDTYSPSAETAPEKHQHRDSATPQLLFAKDAASGQFEPIKSRSIRRHQEKKFPADAAKLPASPWYSGPFAPSKRSSESPADEIFKSPSIRNMKPRHEFKGDFISEPNRAGNVFSHQSRHDEDEGEWNGKEPYELDVASAIAFGQKHGYWVGPKGTGQFAVPESDSDEDEDEDENEPTPVAGTEGVTATLTPPGHEPVRTSENVFSKSQAEAFLESDTTPPTPTPISKDTDALARARSQAEKYKPKTPSTLRATSALPSPLSTPRDAGSLSGKSEESGEVAGRDMPRLAPAGIIASPLSKHYEPGVAAAGEVAGRDTPRLAPTGLTTTPLPQDDAPGLASHREANSVATDPVGPAARRLPPNDLATTTLPHQDDNTTDKAPAKAFDLAPNESSAETSDNDSDDQREEKSIAYAIELANKLPVEELFTDQFKKWPGSKPAPWAHLIDDQVRACLEATMKEPTWEAECKEVWRKAMETYKMEVEERSRHTKKTWKEQSQRERAALTLEEPVDVYGEGALADSESP